MFKPFFFVADKIYLCVDTKIVRKRSGNFRALIQYRADGGDAVLKQHLEMAPGNAKYLSKTILNELTSIIGQVIWKNR